MSTLVLLRHGQSEWNRTNQFTGWYDSPLTEQGRAEAVAAGDLLRAARVAPTVVHTSLQSRAIHTAEIALGALGRSWVPVRRSWRLNERHYGDLTGLDKAETQARHGAEQVLLWRRSYDTPPPPISDGNPWNPNDDERYVDLAPELIPRTECLADVVARMLPYWYDSIVADLRAGEVVLVAAHGNSLRALVMHLDGISAADIAELNLPTGMPLLYDLDHDLRPTEARHPLERALDPEAARAGAEAVRNQTAAQQ